MTILCSGRYDISLTFLRDMMVRKPNKDKVTSKKAASAASKVLRDPKSSPSAKKAAGSALAQRPSKGSLGFVTKRPISPPKKKR